MVKFLKKERIKIPLVLILRMKMAMKDLIVMMKRYLK
jgi:hypothetical protein